MLFIEYPITGPQRFPQLIMEFVFLIACVELGIFFFIRYIKQDKELRNLQDLGFSVLLMGYGLMVFWFMIGDYYAPNYSIRLPFLILGYTSTMLAAWIFIICMEKYKKYFLIKYFFSFGYLLNVLIFFIGLIIDPETSRILSVVQWPIFLLFFIIYLIDFAKNVQNREKILFGLLKFLPGFAFLIIGFTFTTDTIERLIGVNLRFYGVFLELISIFLLSFFFFSLAPFSEFEWFNKMEHVFIIHKSGLCLYNQQLDETVDIMDENLVAGAISSVNFLLEELTSDEGIVVINKKDKTIVISPGNNTFGIMFCSEELNYIKVLLKRFVEKFEAVYQNILADWDGEMGVFNPTKAIVKEIFHREQ